MAKAILIQNMDEKCNEAINIKRAELLLQGKDFVKSEVVVAILHEWLEAKHNCISFTTNPIMEYK
jgi:hypothetical protein